MGERFLDAFFFTLLVFHPFPPTFPFYVLHSPVNLNLPSLFPVALLVPFFLCDTQAAIPLDMPPYILSPLPPVLTSYPHESVFLFIMTRSVDNFPPSLADFLQKLPFAIPPFFFKAPFSPPKIFIGFFPISTRNSWCVPSWLFVPSVFLPLALYTTSHLPPPPIFFFSFQFGLRSRDRTDCLWYSFPVFLFWSSTFPFLFLPWPLDFALDPHRYLFVLVFTYPPFFSNLFSLPLSEPLLSLADLVVFKFPSHSAFFKTINKEQAFLFTVLSFPPPPLGPPFFSSFYLFDLCDLLPQRYVLLLVYFEIAFIHHLSPFSFSPPYHVFFPPFFSMSGRSYFLFHSFPPSPSSVGLCLQTTLAW